MDPTATSQATSQATMMPIDGGMMERSQLQVTMIWMERGTPRTKEYSIIAVILMSTESFDIMLSRMTRGQALNFLQQPKNRSRSLRKHLAFHSYRYYEPCIPSSLTAVLGQPAGLQGFEGATTSERMDITERWIGIPTPIHQRSILTWLHM